MHRRVSVSSTPHLALCRMFTPWFSSSTISSKRRCARMVSSTAFDWFSQKNPSTVPTRTFFFVLFFPCRSRTSTPRRFFSSEPGNSTHHMFFPSSYSLDEYAVDLSHHSNSRVDVVWFADRLFKSHAQCLLWFSTFLWALSELWTPFPGVYSLLAS